MQSVDTDLQIVLDMSSEGQGVQPDQYLSEFSSIEQVATETQNSTQYRIYGTYHVLSPLVGITRNPQSLQDLFTEVFTNEITMNEMFNLFIVQPTVLDYIQTFSDGTLNYGMYGKKVTVANNVNLFNAGYSNNYYYEQLFQYTFQNVLDITDQYIQSNDNLLNYPISQVYLYLEPTDLYYGSQYQLTEGNAGYSTTKPDDNNIWIGNFTFDPQQYTLVENYTPLNRIIFPTTNAGTLIYLFNPFQPIQLFDLSANLKSGSSVDTDGIPQHALLTQDLSGLTPTKTEVFQVPINVLKSYTQLIPSDPQGFPPRQIIQNPQTLKYEYYLANPLSIYPSLSISITTGIGTQVLTQGVDYVVSQSGLKIIFTDSQSAVIPGCTLTFEYLSGVQYLWRDILPNSFIEPLSNLGTRYPYINGLTYVWVENVIEVYPDLSDPATNTVYNQFVFGISTAYSQPNTNLAGSGTC